MTEEVGLMDSNIRQGIFDAMQANKPPFAAYKKTLLGQVVVRYLDPIRMRPEEVILKGDPNNPADEETCIIKVWSAAEDTYLRRNNKIHLEKGTLIPAAYKEEPIPDTNQISDEEIERVLEKPFFALKNKLAEFTSPIPLRRFLLMAEKLNRPHGTVTYIKSILEKMEIEK
jgi:hypothetical protein